MDNGRVRRPDPEGTYYLYPILGVLAAAFTLCAIVARRRVKLHEDSEQQSDEATEMSGEALVLLLWGAMWCLGQALMARVAVEATHHVSTLLEQLLILSNVWILADVLAWAVGRGHLDGTYRYVLFTGSGMVPLPFRLLFSAGLVIVLIR